MLDFTISSSHSVPISFPHEEADAIKRLLHRQCPWRLRQATARSVLSMAGKEVEPGVRSANCQVFRGEAVPADRVALHDSRSKRKAEIGGEFNVTSPFENGQYITSYVYKERRLAFAATRR